MIIKNRKGGAAVEFALILPLLILLLFGIIEFGLLAYNKQIITNASREGARAGVVMQVPERLSDAAIQAVARRYAENHLVTFGSGIITFSPSISPAEPRSGTLFGTDLTFTVVYPYDFLVLSALGFGQVNLRAQTTMKME